MQRPSMNYISRLDADGVVHQFFRMGTTLLEHLSLLSQLVILALLAYGYKAYPRHRFHSSHSPLIGGRGYLYYSHPLPCSLLQHQPGQSKTAPRPCLVLLFFILPLFSSQKQNKFCQAYNLGLYILQCLLLLLTIISVNWSISSLRSSLNTSPWRVTSTPLTYFALQHLHFLRALFLIYLFLPTLLMFSRLMLFSCSYAWIDSILQQSINLAILVALAINFAPNDKTFYYKPLGLAAQSRMPSLYRSGSCENGVRRRGGRGRGGGGRGAIFHPAERLRQLRVRNKGIQQ